MKLNPDLIRKMVKGETSEEFPQSINELLEIIPKLKINKEKTKLLGEEEKKEEKIKLKKLSVGMSPKKIHEVFNIASVISNVSKQTSSNVCADIGSGTG